MSTQTFKKSEIALLQLKAAINLFYKHDYVSSLTLSGAAQEIISNMCRARGLEFSFRFPAEALPDLKNATPDKLEKYIYSFLNKTKNQLKHQNSFIDLIVEADFKFETEMFIANTIDNYKMLFSKLPDDEIIMKFYQDNPL